MIQPAYQGDGPYIFISYAHKDKGIVFPFIEALQKKHNVWYDEGIKYDKEWTAEILDRLEHCTLFLFLITENSMKSENCKDEIHQARESGRNFINILLSPNVTLSKEFQFRYGRYQMCRYYEFQSPEEVIEDLRVKTAFLDETRSAAWERKEPEGKGRESSEKEKAMRKSPEPTEEPETKVKSLEEANIHDIIEFGHFPQDGDNQPIRWIVLYKDKTELVLVSEKVLFAAKNQAWAYSMWGNLKDYLNETFFGYAFTRQEQGLISKCTLTDGGYVVTSYHVGMLTRSNLEAWMPFEKDRIAQTTVYGKKNGVKKGLFADGVDWWLQLNQRGDDDRTLFDYVDGKGHVKESKNKQPRGIRPKIVINFKKKRK